MFYDCGSHCHVSCQKFIFIVCVCAIVTHAHHTTRMRRLSQPPFGSYRHPLVIHKLKWFRSNAQQKIKKWKTMRMSLILCKVDTSTRTAKSSQLCFLFPRDRKIDVWPVRHYKCKRLEHIFHRSFVALDLEMCDRWRTCFQLSSNAH